MKIEIDIYYIDDDSSIYDLLDTLDSVEADLDRILRKLSNPVLRAETRTSLSVRLSELNKVRRRLKMLLSELQLREEEHDVVEFLENLYDDDTLGDDGSPLMEEVVHEVKLPWE